LEDYLKKPTIRDVARLSGVGIATVSRVLNGGSVKLSTKKRVIWAIKNLGYEPNTSARTLAGGKTRRVLLFMPEVRTEFHWRVMKAFDDALDSQNYEMVIYPMFSGKRLERLYNDNSLLRDSDGAVTFTMNMDFLLKSRIDFGRNLVLFESQSDDYDCVYLDNVLGGRLAAEILIENGAKEFFTVTFDERNSLLATENFDKRQVGFSKALEKSGYRLKKENTVYSSFFFETAHERIVEILSECDRPGIFALADNFALEILQTASAMKKVPGVDFFLIGYDNQSWTERAGLTTINQPMEDMGKKAAELIVQKIENPVSYLQPVKFLPEVVRRKTA
jgi:LacI family transcriptional regulator